MDVSALSRELQCVASLVDAQVQAGLDRDEVLESLCSSWAGRLAALVGQDNTSLCTLTRAVSEGPWSVEQRKRLAKALTSGGEPGGQGSKRRPSQTCTHFENYLTENEWKALRTPGTTHSSRVALLALRAWLIGLELPSEPTLFRMVAVLAFCAGNHECSQEDVSETMRALQAQVKSRAGRGRAVQVPHLVHFPHSASGLAESTLSVAYGDEGRPVDVEFPELDTILGSNKMRSSKANWLKHVPEHMRPLVQAAVQRSRSGRLSPARGASSSWAEPAAPGPTTPVALAPPASPDLGSAMVLREQLTRAAPRQPATLPSPAQPTPARAPRPREVLVAVHPQDPGTPPALLQPAGSSSSLANGEHALAEGEQPLAAEGEQPLAEGEQGAETEGEVEAGEGEQPLAEGVGEGEGECEGEQGQGVGTPRAGASARRGAQPLTEGVQSSGSLDEMEAQLLAAAAKRGDASKKAKQGSGSMKKRPAAAAAEEPAKRPAPAEPVKKRPAAAAAQPAAAAPAAAPAAAAQPDMSAFFARLETEASTLSRNVCVSRAYHAGKRRAVAAGYDDSAARRFAQEQMHQAGDLWTRAKN